MRRFRELTTETRRLLQHRRLQRRHPRLPLDPGPPRRGAAGRLRLPRPAGRRAPARRGRGARGRRTTSPTAWPRRPTGCDRAPLARRRWRAAGLRSSRPATTAAAKTGIVHLGIGAFHRAHQAVVYRRPSLRGGDRLGHRRRLAAPPDMRDALAPQDGLYTPASSATATAKRCAVDGRARGRAGRARGPRGAARSAWPTGGSASSR